MGTGQQTPTEALPGSSDLAMTFAARFNDAAKWEQTLMDGLTWFGWDVSPFGQAQIPETIRRALASWRDEYDHPTLIRWLPDMIASCPTTGELCLIDAKSERRSDTSNFAIEAAAVDAGRALANHLRIPVFYVWPGGLTLTPESVFDDHHVRLDGNNTQGSGTPFYLIDKSFAVATCWDRRPPQERSLDEIVSQPQQMELL